MLRSRRFQTLIATYFVLAVCCMMIALVDLNLDQTLIEANKTVVEIQGSEVAHSITWLTDALYKAVEIVLYIFH